MAEEEDAELRAIAAVMAQKEAELQELQLLAGMAATSPFAPTRLSIQRTPPPSCPPLVDLTQQQPVAPSAKRKMSSPEEVQEALRMRMASRAPATGKATPPISGIAHSTDFKSVRKIFSPHQQQQSTAPPAAAIPTRASTTTQQQPKHDDQQSSRPPSPPLIAIDDETKADDADEDAPTTTLAKLSVMQLVNLATTHSHELISIVTNRTKSGSTKLNVQDTQSCSYGTERLVAIVTQLSARCSDAQERAVRAEGEARRLSDLLRVAEQRIAAASTAQPAQQQPQQTLQQQPLYSNALKVGKNREPMKAAGGQVVLFYPKDAEAIKTAEETKAELQKTVQPGSQGIAIIGVRKVGNSGVAVRTTDEQSAAKLRSAAPPSLKVVEPKQRRPLVALNSLRCDPENDALVHDLHAMNLSGDADWTLERVKEACRVAFKKNRRDGKRTTVVLECKARLRDKLIALGTVYVGWDAVDVTDYIRVTCCNKCQNYGHPAKYCRAKEMVCSKCGETGHKHTECLSETVCCATCKQFKHKDAASHATLAATCPARLHAEQQAVNMTWYG
ncbi:hypothetical protein O0L34_g19203 [Tuta absoluta]|nr:hypothetical protein O0L34_g19203 [Tuta absoluta]